MTRTASTRSALAFEKPVSLNIVKAKPKVDDSASGSSSSDAPSDATKKRSPHVGKLSTLRPETQISLAETTDTEHTHARALNSQSPSIGSDVSDVSDEDDEDYDAGEHARSRRSLHGNPNTPNRDSQVTEILDTPASNQSPFADSPISPRLPSDANGTRDAGPSSNSRGVAAAPVGLAVVIEEATKRASKEPATGGLASARPRDRSPFGDENEVERR